MDKSIHAYLMASSDMRAHLLALMAENKAPTIATLKHLIEMDSAVVGQE